MTKNVNRVPKKQWMKWSAGARVAFNRSYEFIYYNQDLIIHPKAATASPIQWKTIAWNAAWIAADATDDSIPTKIVTVERRKRRRAAR